MKTPGRAYLSYITASAHRHVHSSHSSLRCADWLPIEFHKYKRKICQRAMERSILGLNSPVQMGFGESRRLDAIREMGKRRHSLRAQRGRSRRRLWDDLDKLEKEWWNIAKDREQWRILDDRYLCRAVTQ